MVTDAALCLKEIGQRILERRKKLGMTQEALAEKGDVTAQFVSYAEAGKRAMRPENLLKIATALEVSADYLPVSYTHLDVYKRQCQLRDLVLRQWPLRVHQRADRVQRGR